jgi:putative DNA primase/helicase
MNNVQITVQNAMRDQGLVPPTTIITDGQLHRFDGLTGKLTGKINCYYTAHVDGRAAGIIGDWAAGMQVTWKAGGSYPKLTSAERTAFALEKLKQDFERKSEQAAIRKAAAQKANYIWSKSPVAPSDHSYLLRKCIKPHGARLGCGNTLVIPVINGGALVSLQHINEDGSKRFLTGGKLKGSYSQLGSYAATDKPILVCEGWATGASLFEATGHLTYVAFSANNLNAVAVYVASLHPLNEVVICGDNDKSGVGQSAANEAASTIGGKCVIPEAIGHDWNDAINAGASL